MVVVDVVPGVAHVQSQLANAGNVHADLPGRIAASQDAAAPQLLAVAVHFEHNGSATIRFVIHADHRREFPEQTGQVEHDVRLGVRTQTAGETLSGDLQRTAIGAAVATHHAPASRGLNRLQFGQRQLVRQQIQQPKCGGGTVGGNGSVVPVRTHLDPNLLIRAQSANAHPVGRRVDQRLPVEANHVPAVGRVHGIPAHVHGAQPDRLNLQLPRSFHWKAVHLARLEAHAPGHLARDGAGETDRGPALVVFHRHRQPLFAEKRFGGTNPVRGLPAREGEMELVGIVPHNAAAPGPGVRGAVVLRLEQIHPALRDVAVSGNELGPWLGRHQGQDPARRRIQRHKHAAVEGTEVLVVPEVEHVHGTIVRQPQFLPAEQNAVPLLLVEIEAAHHVVASPQVRNFQVPDSLGAMVREEVQRPNVRSGVDATQDLHPLRSQVRQPGRRQQGLSRESLQRRPHPGLIQRQRLANQHHVRVVVPGHVVQEVPAHGGVQRHEEAIPAEHHVAARTRAVHDPDSGKRNAPAAEQVAVFADRTPDGPQRLPVQLVRIPAGIPEKLALGPVLLDHDGLAVDFEVVVPPGDEPLEELPQVGVPGGSGRIHQVLPLPRVRGRAAIRFEQKRPRMRLDHLGIALPVRSEPEPRREAELPDFGSQHVHPFGEALVDRGPVAVVAEPVAAPLPTVVDLNDLRAVVLEVLGHPPGVAQHLVRADLLVVEVPRAPAGRRQREVALVDRPEVADTQ